MGQDAYSTRVFKESDDAKQFTDTISKVSSIKPIISHIVTEENGKTKFSSDWAVTYSNTIVEDWDIPF
jgi:hypothetical protein